MVLEVVSIAGEIVLFEAYSRAAQSDRMADQHRDHARRGGRNQAAGDRRRGRHRAHHWRSARPACRRLRSRDGMVCYDDHRPTPCTWQRWRSAVWFVDRLVLGSGAGGRDALCRPGGTAVIIVVMSMSFVAAPASDICVGAP